MRIFGVGEVVDSARDVLRVVVFRSLPRPLVGVSGSALMEVPDPQYVTTDDGAFIAYQVVGEGPIDVAWQLDFGGNLDVWWESGWIRGWFEGLASFGRLILHDWRGCGLSSRNVSVPNLETRTDDLRAVLDEVGSTSAVMHFGVPPCLKCGKRAGQRCSEADRARPGGTRSL
jgi:hypothetical protein